MASKKELQKLMETRSPLRKTVKPVDMYDVEKSTSIQVDKTTNPQVDKYTSTQVVKPTSTQVHKTTSTQTDKTTSGQVVKYTTHLTKETVMAVKQYALSNSLKDYEVVQKALDDYLKGKK